MFEVEKLKTQNLFLTSFSILLLLLSYFPLELRANSSEKLNENQTLVDVDQVCGDTHRPIRIFRKRGEEKLGILEFGLKGGTTHSFTDIQRNKGLGIIESFTSLAKRTGYNAGIFFNYRHVNHFGLGVGVNYISISGLGISENTDYIFADDMVTGFSYENQIFEFNGRLMFYAPISSQRVFDVYAFFGLSVFYNSLELKDQNQEIISPEEEHNNVQLAIPIGIGISVKIGRSFSLGFESGYRYTPFNYLDGINLPDTRYDAFFLNQLKLGFFFN